MSTYQKIKEEYKRIHTTSPWGLVETKTEVVDQEFVKRFKDGAGFMKDLGGSERWIVTIGGYKNISVSPDNLTKIVTYFKRL